MSSTIADICSRFQVNSVISPYGNGHINDTYLADESPRIILQRINTKVFTRPEEVMSNIDKVTRHLTEKILAVGGDPMRETLTVIPTRDGELFYRDEDGKCYRMYYFVERSVTHETAETPRHLYEAGRAFGRFQRRLDDFPAEELFTVIERFHDTEDRVSQLRDALQAPVGGRELLAAPEIEAALHFASYASLINDAMKAGTVPTRVTHNDTKLNNILFSAEDDTALCVIDLDTVMKGSLLYDFGDALRFGASSAAEDETELSKVWFDLTKFRAFAEGFLPETRDCLTEAEKALLPVSVLILTYECGIRFLADYLRGDTYFKVHREGHNLDRARTQLKLVADIEKKLPEMEAIVKDILG